MQSGQPDIEGQEIDSSQRQLPTDHDYAVPTPEYQTDQSSLKPAQTAARSVLGDEQRQRQKQTHRLAELRRSLHIRATRSTNSGLEANCGLVLLNALVYTDSISLAWFFAVP